MDLHEIDPDRVDADPTTDRLVDGLVGLGRAVVTADSPWEHPPTRRSVVGWLRHGWDGERPRTLVGVVEDRVVASGELRTSEWDNRDLAWLGLAVHPEQRRRGRGAAMLAALGDLARQVGRTRLGADGWDLPAVTGFAAQHGFERRSQALERRMLLAETDPEAIERLVAEATRTASAYELLMISGRTPEELLGPMAVMVAAINDAPLDDLDLEDEAFPPERVRGYEEATLARGQRLHRLVARHRESGVLAGHTVVAVEEERPWIGEQHDTSVVREHRGHRLGLLLKASMVQRLAEVEPHLETVDTWNAESNDHMVAVNQTLGYQVMGRGLQYLRDLDGAPVRPGR